MAIAVKNLVKIYKSKNRASLQALKGVSFNLPDTGMVFVLGKSGCGKSTLLNLLGGLDGFDGGDIVIDGKSLKSFNGNDLDRYRNDYIGFVFQENNLLEKESVRRNVGLALELQSEKDTDGRVEAVLDSVGLNGYAERSCNRLSGGQKQRVTIARALIKSPKLILCDEPTGALDSETGADIFTLLKELSSERLVVVVSHDRESAEKYGDRVIEIKDGEIISDSAPLNEVAASEQTKAKHGGLHFLRALSIGAGYIIARPIRMAICLLLCLITFTCVGFSDILYAYDEDKVVLNTMEKMGSDIFVFGKTYFNGNEFNMVGPEMTSADAEELKSLISVVRCDNIYKFGIGSNHFYELSDISEYLKLSYATANGYIEADAGFLEDYGYNLLAGRLPENNGEAALPLYLFNYFKAYKYCSKGEFSKINSYEDIIGKTVTVQVYGLEIPPFTVTGIIDTHCNFEKQYGVLFCGETQYGDFIRDMHYIDNDKIHNSLFVCKGFNAYYTENFVEDEEEERVLRVIAPFKGSHRQKLENLRVWKKQYAGLPVEVGGNCYHIVNCYAERINGAAEMLNEIQSFAIYGVLGMVIIATLFIMYYSSGTIDEKRREIGILRALGASRGDIVKITASEHGIFTAAAVVISAVLSAIAGVIFNNSIVTKYRIDATFVSFGIRQFAVVLAVAILAVVLGIAFPLIKLLRKKPVDVIADRK